MKICEGIGGEGGSWFEESIHRKVGNGLTTFFWTNCWVGRFPSMIGLCLFFIYLFIRI